MKIDVVIISDAKDDYLKSLTQQAIKTCIENERIVSVNVFVIERQNIYHDNAITIHVDTDIEYNKFLNLGASYGNSDYIFFGNNDLIFGKNWAHHLISEMRKEKANSASPYCPIHHKEIETGISYNTGIYEGYEVRREFSGWAFCLTRELWNRIGGLDERFIFWCADNATVKQLQLHNEKHILVTSSIVKHIGNGSKTLEGLPIIKKDILMRQQVRIFNKLYKENLFDLGCVSEKVTVCIPIFGDEEKYLNLADNAIQSVKGQTEKSVSLNISIADNLMIARNIVGLNAETDYLIFLDADDTLDLHYIESMLKVDADVVVPTVHRYYSDGTVNKDQYWYTPTDLMERNYIVVGSMIKTSMFKKVGGFHDLPIYEDWQLWLRMQEAGAKFKQCPDAIYNIHVRDNSRNEQDEQIKQDTYQQIKKEAIKRRNL